MITTRFLFTIDPLDRANELAKGLRNKVIRIAMNKASGPVKDRVIANAPVLTGSLQKSIRIRIKNYKKSETWVSIIGPKSDYTRKKKKMLIKPSRTAHLVEWGSKRIKARPFLKPAYDASRQQFFDTLIAKIGEQVDAILRV